MASSDHGFGVAYAVVFAPENTRESIWQAMWDRRTYGSTTYGLVLDVRSGEHWMGEHWSSEQTPQIDVFVRGAAPIRSVEILGRSFEKQVLVLLLGKLLLEFGLFLFVLARAHLALFAQELEVFLLVFDLYLKRIANIRDRNEFIQYFHGRIGLFDMPVFRFRASPAVYRPPCPIPDRIT